MIKLILRYLPFLKILGGWQGYALIAAVCLSVGAYGAYRITVWKYASDYSKALETALEVKQIEIDRQNKAIREANIEKEAITKETSLKIRRLQNALNKTDCGRQPVGDTAYRLLQAPDS